MSDLPPPNIPRLGQQNRDDDDSEQGQRTQQHVPPQQPYPPQGQQQPGYPPQQQPGYPQQPPGYPPQQQPGYPPQQPPRPSQQYPPSQQSAGGLEPVAVPRLGAAPRSSSRLGGADSFGSPVAPQLKSESPGGLLGTGFLDGKSIVERRIEYLAWGSVILLLGFSLMALIFSPEKGVNLFTLITPLLAGGILLLSGVLQKLVMGFNVSLFTWAVALFSTSFGLTRLIAVAGIFQFNGVGGIIKAVIFFISMLIIMAGAVVFLQVFVSADG